MMAISIALEVIGKIRKIIAAWLILKDLGVYFDQMQADRRIWISTLIRYIPIEYFEKRHIR